MISAIRLMPSWPMSSSRPTKGEMNVAPALAASSAWAAEKHRVTFTIVPSEASALQVFSPSGVSGTFTATFLASLASFLPSSSIFLWSVATVSALTGPGTMAQISLITSSIGRPDFMIREGLVVTPSSRPDAARSLISATSAVSTKNFISTTPMASGSDSPVTTISSDSPSEPQAKGPASPRPESVENVNRRTVRVLLPLPLADAYDYSVPDGLEVADGHFVVVPLGKRETIGVVWGKGSGEVAPAKLRDIVAVLPALPMADALRRFVDWVTAYTLAPPGAVLRMAMSVPSALEAPKTEIVYRAAPMSEDEALKLTDARRRVLEQLKDGPALPLAELAHLAGVGTSVVKTMATIGLLEGVERTVRRRFAEPDGKRQGPVLSPEQAVAAQGLVDKVLAHSFSATLLDGVPGSGKTEVYFEAIGSALASGRQVLVLLPEIALTAQWLKRFEDRFGALPAAWHSGLTSLERRETWRAIAEGRVGVVVGARSALFLPFANLGLIVVDEEHDSSFKQ